MNELVGRLRRLIRPDAPERSVAITFRTVQPVPMEPSPAIGKVRLPQKEMEQGIPIEYLRGCVREARRLGRCNLSVAKRVPLSEEFHRYFVPIANRLIELHADDGGVPDGERRQEALDAAIQVLGLLIESYKIVFKEAYGGAGFALFGSVRHVELGAYRILELIRLQQRIKGLRFQVLSDATWLVANTVYHAMHAAGQADAPVAVPEAAAPGEAVAPQSLRELFLCIQMIAKLNVLRWPTEWQGYLHAWTRWASDLVRLTDDDGSELPRDVAVAYCYGSRAARPKRADGEAELGPASLIHWGKLIKHATSNFLLLFNDYDQGDRTKIPKVLAELSYNEALALVQLQFECATSEQPQAESDGGSGRSCDMRLFIGFNSVYHLLRNMHGGGYGGEVRLADELAKRSAVFADDHRATDESIWLLQFEDATVLRLRTQESKFTTRIKLGLLAAYGVGDEGIAHPQFGIVSRIHRIAEQTVTVEIQKFGEYVEPALVSTDLDAFATKDSKNGIVLGAILVRDGMGETKLLVPPVGRLQGKSRLMMKRRDSREVITLGRLQAVTKDLFMLRFASAAAAGDRPAPG